MRLSIAFVAATLSLVACGKKADEPPAGPAPSPAAAIPQPAAPSAPAAPSPPTASAPAPAAAGTAPACDAYFAAVGRFLECPALQRAKPLREAIEGGKARIEQAMARLEALRISDPAVYAATLELSARSCEAAMTMLERSAATTGCPAPR